MYHSTLNNEFFTVYKARNFGKVKMGNNNNADIMRVGDMCTQTNIGYTLTLKDMRHMPNLCLNLISVHALDLAEYHSNFGNGK